MTPQANDTVVGLLLKKRSTNSTQQYLKTPTSFPKISSSSSLSVRNCGLRSITSKGKLRHTSDSNLYDSANKRGSWGRSRSSKSLCCSKNEEFALQPGASLCIAQRAGAGAIRAIIANIELKMLKVDEYSPSSSSLHEESDSIDEEEDYDPPTVECTALSQWSSDPYYRAVISTSGGIPAVLQAMRAYPRSAELQMAACTVLKNLGRGSIATQKVIFSAGGKDALVEAATNYPDCAEIQGAVEATLRIASNV
eukprot:CAMPEP_0185724244 /NCGR_PEP_ID=MMETSP1171-20130828/787_1 /TAXON_ID=374046 /ORGANISM="Helicotheca tamensis, Strain CCMP826" /LENGTH=251 /DNA_ID=CAMNT_0028392051 /DNA_START=159 /DNA_END=914 /DNA_ORIENTATION=-